MLVTTVVEKGVIAPVVRYARVREIGFDRSLGQHVYTLRSTHHFEANIPQDKLLDDMKFGRRYVVWNQEERKRRQQSKSWSATIFNLPTVEQQLDSFPTPQTSRMYPLREPKKRKGLLDKFW